MSRHLLPIFPRVSGDRVGMVDSSGHDLTDAGTVEDGGKAAKAIFLTTPHIAGLDLGKDDIGADVGVGDRVGG